MKKIAIYGAGGLGREVLALIRDINRLEQQWNIIGFFDDELDKGVWVNDCPTLGAIEDLNECNQEIAVAICVGDPMIKKQIFEKIHNPMVTFPSLIHPSVWIGNKDYVEIGKGSILCAGVMVTTNIVIKDFVLLNLQCTVGHDTVINDYVSVMPSVNISGQVTVGEGVFVGAGAIINNQLEIGPHSYIGAGAVVTDIIPAGCTAVGVPARPIKYHSQG